MRDRAAADGPAGSIFRDAARGILQRPAPPVMPGTVQRRPEEPTTERPPSEGGSRREVKSEILVTNVGGAGVFTDAVARFKVTIPSVRLAWLIAWTFEPDNNEDTTFPAALPTAWVVTADAWIRAQQGKARMMRGNNLFTNRAIPTTWEATSSGVPEVRGTVTVPGSGGGGLGSGIIAGKLWITAYWEPAPGWSPNDDELGRLFDVCRVEVTHGITVTQNGGQIG